MDKTFDEGICFAVISSVTDGKKRSRRKRNPESSK
jgi:hypothetical protein